MIILVLVLYPLVWCIIQRTSIGRKFRAVEVDRELAELSAVPTVKVVTATFIVGSALSAIPAGLTALDIDLTPIMGFPAILVGLVSIVVGGTESIAGCALSGFLVGVLQNVAAYLVGSRWQNSAVYLTLLLVLLCRPLGLLGRASTRLVGQK
jgi:branched-chain amino acid transport system permease protein